jgi:hypothetical protein
MPIGSRDEPEYSNYFAFLPDGILRALLPGMEDTDMSATGRILAGIVVAVLLLSLALLEIVSERITSSAYLADPQGGRQIERIVVLQSGWVGEESPEQ